MLSQTSLRKNILYSSQVNWKNYQPRSRYGAFYVSQKPALTDTKYVHDGIRYRSNDGAIRILYPSHFRYFCANQASHYTGEEFFVLPVISMSIVY